MRRTARRRPSFWICALLTSVAVPGAQALPALPAGPVLTSSQSHIETAGTAMAVAIPVLAGGVSLYKEDWKGAAQLTVETVLTVGTTYALKNIVRENRPDLSDRQSFPSETTALAGSGASYLWGRYGWQYGLPAYAATGFVAYSRVQANKHRWYDTLAGAALSAGYGYFVTTPFHRRYNISTSLSATPDGGFVQMAYRW